MHKVVSVEPMGDYQLRVTFDDNTTGIVSLGERLFGPVSEPLRDPAIFRKVFVDEFGVICWPNGADLAPDALYEKIRVPSAATR